MTTKAKQQTPTRPKKREPRTHIVSFRLRETEANLLLADMKKNPHAGFRSLKQFCRKISVDYALSRLIYIMPLDRMINFDSREYLEVEPPNCQMSDKRFLKALRDFLTVPENWHKLRLFMLRAGWPEKLKAEFLDAENDQERLIAAQKVLTEMLVNNHHELHADKRQS